MRVQALTTAAFTQQFLEAYNEDDTFFLYDPARNPSFVTGETIARHLAAGRHHLAAALQQYAQSVS